MTIVVLMLSIIFGVIAAMLSKILGGYCIELYVLEWSIVLAIMFVVAFVDIRTHRGN